MTQKLLLAQITANQLHLLFLMMYSFHGIEFLCGEWEYTRKLAEAFANHHRQSCIGARAGLGDMIIGASALMSEYNGAPYNKVSHIRRSMGELIRITEGFYAAGVAAAVYGHKTVGVIMSQTLFNLISVNGC